MTFDDALRAAAERRRIPIPPLQHPEPLAGLSYPVELMLKREALLAFWEDQKLPGKPEPIVGALEPRRYRTTTKRRVNYGIKGVAFGFATEQRRGLRLRLGPSLLDLPEHVALYDALLERLSKPGGITLASVLNWLVVRGSGKGLALILNVCAIDARIVRAAKALAEWLQGSTLGVRSAFLYVDPTRSEYYLEAQRPEDGTSFKRLYGPTDLQVEVDGVRLRFPTTAFSQVSASMAPLLVQHAGTLLGPLEGITLLDLYCGYGLFTMTLGRTAAHVLGVDFDNPAVEAAKANAEHLHMSNRTRFLSGKIDGALLERRLRPARGPEVALLDPPRQGTSPDVSEALAERGVERVLHICCGTDQIPREVSQWTRVGYRLERAVPIDLFAGTAGLETLLLFIRERDWVRPDPDETPEPSARVGRSAAPAWARRSTAPASSPRDAARRKPTDSASIQRPQGKPRKETPHGDRPDPAQRRTRPHQDGGRAPGRTPGSDRGVLGGGKVRPRGERPRPGKRGPGRPGHRPDE